MFNFLKPGQPGYDAELDPASPKFKKEKYKIELLNRFDNRFNEFQSVAANEDNPAALARGNLKNAITTALQQFVIDPQQKPETDEVLVRAAAFT